MRISYVVAEGWVCAAGKEFVYRSPAHGKWKKGGNLSQLFQATNEPCPKAAATAMMAFGEGLTQTSKDTEHTLPLSGWRWKVVALQPLGSKHR